MGKNENKMSRELKQMDECSGEPVGLAQCDLRSEHGWVGVAEELLMSSLLVFSHGGSLIILLPGGEGQTASAAKGGELTTTVTLILWFSVMTYHPSLCMLPLKNL